MLECITRLFSRNNPETDENKHTIDDTEAYYRKATAYYRQKVKEADEQKRLLDICIDLLEPYRRINTSHEQRIAALEKALAAKQQIPAQR